MFLDMKIHFPGAASDFYDFDESYLKVKLEREGLLKTAYTYLETLDQELRMYSTFSNLRFK